MTDALVVSATGEPARAGLVRRAMEGDHAAFDALIRPGLDRQLRFAISLLGDETDARDIVQETCLRAWRELPRLRDVARFDSWMNQILVNLARSQLRIRHRVSVRELPADDIIRTGRETASAPSAADSVPERDLIRRAFGRLDDDKRLLLAMRHVQELSVLEIARQLGIPEGTAKWRLHAARAALERALEIEQR
jgi:RNA polymerase sigma-70 factor (ECF subfamily)